MELGKHLRELARLRAAAVACLAVALLAAISASYQIHLFPPGLQTRPLQIATATSEILVDTPYSTAVDTRGGRADFDMMTSRATLLGNVIASPPVLEYIARRAHVPAAQLRAQPPLTPDFPRPLAAAGQERSAKDILKLPDEYRINVQVDPSVPVMRILADAPTAAKAVALSTAAVNGLQDYLDAIAARDGTPAQNRIRLEPLGKAHGVVINGGVRLQASILAFFVVFGLTAAAAVFIARVRRGWRAAGPHPAETRSGLSAVVEGHSAELR